MKKTISMKKIISCSCIFLIALLITGCSGSTQTSGVTTNYKIGNGDLNVKLIDNAPPSEIFPGAEFKIIAELSNQLAYDAKNLDVVITGLEPGYFQVYPLEQKIALIQGKSITNPAGDKEMLEFSGNAGSLVKSAQYYTNKYLLQTNYDSTMEFQDTVCINTDLYGVNDAGCKVQDKLSYPGQGAVLAVSKMEQVVISGSSAGMQFRIYLTNRGQGKLKLVTLDKSELGGEALDCQFQGEVDKPLEYDFKDKQTALLLCDAAISEQISYQTILALDFSYHYELNKEYQLKIVNPNAALVS